MSTESKAVPSPVVKEPVHHFLRALAADDGKGRPDGVENVQKPEQYLANPSVLAMSKSVFLPGKSWRLRLTRSASLSTSSGGTMSLATAVYPSQFSQYGGLSNLFSQARLISTRITYVMKTSTSTSPVPLMSAFDPNSSYSTPTYVQAQAIVGSKPLNTWNNNGPWSTLTNHWKSPAPRPWSTLAASGSGTDPLSGVIGSWYHVLGDTGPTSAIVAYYLIEADYEFRNQY